jgi:hypothetical protein
MELNKQMELFEDGDTSIDTSKLKSGVKEKKDARKIQFDSMTKMLTSGKVKDLSIEEKDKFVKLYKMLKQHHSFNEGGVAKQMELFEDGGLKDEGGMIDEVSGNDVPTGSTREEVRDDIPAQLSEGEFVFPADVVRYHGLDKLMQLRDEAKMGLRKMEDMGQMGNSEEATLPDDMPFSMEDLDMEDEPQEMAEGGYVMVAGKPMPIPMIGGQLPPITTKPMPETKNMAVGGMMTPSTYQVPTNIATQPSYFQNYAQSTAPFQPFQPQTPIPNAPFQGLNNAVGQNTTGPSFNTLMPQLTGKRETKEYRNAAGQKLFIPFISGKPIYPIPEGYTLYTAEAVKDTTPAPTSQSTSVRQEGGESSDPLSGTTSVRGLDNSVVSTDFSGKSATDISKSMGNMSAADRGLAVTNALSNAQERGALGNALGMMAMGMVPGIGIAGTAVGKGFGVNPNAPDRTGIDSVLGAFGYDAKSANVAMMTDPMANIGTPAQTQNAVNTMSKTEMASNAVQEAISQAMYGMSKAQATSMLGVPANTTLGKRGYKNGQSDPGHGGTYSYGQSVNSNGDVSYSSVTDFGIGMTAMGTTGFMGSLADADRVMNSPTATQKQKDAAKKYKNIVTKKSKYGKDVDVNAISERSFGDDKGGTGTGDPDDDDSANTNTGYTAPSLSTVTSMPSNMTPNNDDEDNNNDNDGGTSSGAGDAEGSVGDGYGGGDYKGAFVGTQYKINKGLAGKKKKPKLKKMKRGGLASRK